MESVLDPQSVDKYLNDIQRLKVISSQQPQKLDELVEYVLSRQKSNADDSVNAHLFSAELAFHKGNFEKALVSYMQARDIPLFEFFCYRATAFVSYQRQDLDKALSFTNKALEIKPHDYDTLNLQHNILATQKKTEEAEKAKQTIQTIESEYLPQKAPPIENPREETHCQEPPFAQGTTSQFIATKLGVDLETEKALEEKIQAFQQLQSKKIEKYLEESKRNRLDKEDFLSILNGWKSSISEIGTQTAFNGFLRDQARQSSSGYFIRWNGKGIVVNPGVNFLENFHEMGLYLGDIHFVVVTQDTPEAYSDIKKIYDFNYRLNKINPELHLIHYYLHHKAYQDLSHTLKPNFKQERNTVHSLELFLDSPDVEKMELAEGITLNYFATSRRGSYHTSSEYANTSHTATLHSIGIRFDLAKTNEKPTKLGYLSATSWSPLLFHHLGSCDILISGVGSTCPNDYGKLNYNESSLGYFGTYTLLEEVKPKLLLLTEFEGREGDIRLEIAKKLRKEYQTAAQDGGTASTVLPADNGLVIQLGTQKVECSISKALLDPKDVIVVKTSETYGNLQYLSPTCLL